MKGWKIEKEKFIVERTLKDNAPSTNFSKVKITTALITLADVLRYQGEISVDKIVLGSSGIGVVSETDANLFELEKGKRVYIDSFSACGKCYNCVSGNYAKCSNILTAGEDYDGFLSDFISVSNEKLFALPDGISDVEALFINHISLATTIIDRLHVQKGDYVAIVGANNLGNILSQLLIYYSAVPILLTTDKNDCEIAKNSGVYYVLGPEDNWQKEVAHITSGRMAEKVVYISDCGIPATKAFSLASVNAGVAFTGNYYKNNPVSFTQAMKKQLEILCINHSSSSTVSSINLILNKAISLSHLKLNESSYEKIPQTFDQLSNEFDNNCKISETVVAMI